MRFKEPYFFPVKLSGDIKSSISVKDVIDLSESTDVLNPILHSVNFSDINVSLNESNHSSFHNSSPLESPFPVHVVHDFLHKELPVYSDCIADHIQDSVTDNHIPCEMVIGPANISDPFKQVLSLEKAPSYSIYSNHSNVSFFSCYHVSNDQPFHSIYSHLLTDIQQPISIVTINVEPPSPVFPVVYTLEKLVSASHSSNYSMLLTSRFAFQTFPSQFDHVNVIQPDGPNVVMKLRWRSSTSSETFLTKGWRRFSLKHGLKAGSLLRFTVSFDVETTMLISIISI
ncbi:hypothetical protein AHAS_Ahas17G0213200 [Arachis hypogaea]